LRLEPEIDIANNVAGWNIVLYESARPNRNLLEPQGPSHGLQPFMIVATDMRLGPEKSTFGAHRTLEVPKRGLIVHVDVKDARVSRDQVTDYYAFELLQVSVSVDNL
jgi:hypothetical protein